MSRLNPFASLLVAALASCALAQNPASQPARVPYVVTTPDRHVRFSVVGREFIALEQDRDWITAAASRVQPVPAPSTQPSNLFDNLTARRDLIMAAMLKDLPTLKPSDIDKLFDTQVLPTLKRYTQTRPAIVYFVSPAEHIRQVMREGWTDRRFHYNRVSDNFDFDRSISLSPEGDSDESLVAAIFSPGETVDARSAALATYINSTETQVNTAVANRAVANTVVLFADFLSHTALNELPTAEDQAWMVTGLSNVLAARYVSKFHGSPSIQFIEALVVSAGKTPVTAASVDLLSPTPISSLKPEYVPATLDARRRKAIAAMHICLTQAGDSKLMPMIEAVQRNRPADGPTLVSVIKDATGYDLTPNLRSR